MLKAIMSTRIIQVMRTSFLAFIEMMISKKTRFGKKRASAAEKIFLSLVFLLVFGGLLGFLIFQNAKIYQKRVQLESRLEDLRTEAQELTKKRDELQAGIVQTQTQEYQEKILREQGLYKKPGEEVVTILPPEEVKQEEPKEEKKRVWWNPGTWVKDN